MQASGNPLTYEASAGQTHLSVSDTLPAEVVQCLKNARFLHLATCTNLQPHVSLMNYTYLPSTPYTSTPVIIMTTNPSSRKTGNMLSNPNVSLLVHDWVSHRPSVATLNPNAPNERGTSPGPPAEASRSSLATLLANLNSSALSSISATINGEARLVDRGTEEERYLRARHLENNTFAEGGNGNGNGGQRGDLWGDRDVEKDDVPPWQSDSTAAENGSSGDGGRGHFIEGEEVRVVVVRITDGRVSDWKGAVRDWTLREEAEGGVRERMVNGV